MITISDIENGFVLNFKNRPVITHSKKRPCVSLGEGEAAYKISHGSFKIKDKVKNRKFLKNWKVLENQRQKAVIQFEETLTMTCQVENNRLSVSFVNSDSVQNRFWFYLNADRFEHIYGCGEQYSKLDLKGQKVPIWVEEQGVGRGHDLITFLAELTHGAGGAWYTTYFPQPTFISSNNYYCHVQTSAYSLFDFSKNDFHTLHVWGVPEEIILDVEESAVTTIESLSSLLGRQPALPDWAHNGIWLGVQGGKEVVEGKLKDATSAGVPVAALWAQDWVGKRITSFGKQLMWDWKYDEETYPDLPGYIRELQEKNVQFLGYINCFLAIEGELYREASASGFLVMKHDGSEYHVYITDFPAAIIDITNPDACKWIKNVIKNNMLGVGLAGWMADFGEYLPTDAILHSGESAETYHNRYAADWAKINMEALVETGNLGKVVFFSRAGYTGSSRYSTLIWGGDQLVNWSINDGLASVIPAGISLGFSGIGLYHSDIGGYTTVGWIKRKKELFMRWAEHAAFSPVMRSHEGNRPDVNWQFNSDQETLSHLARMTKAHVLLKPYLLHMQNEYLEKGLPMMRHPYIHYENDQQLHELQYQYLFGRDMMVAPVYRKIKRKQKVYLPDDTWVHAWTGKEYAGGWHRVNAPLGEPPVFYRKGSEFSQTFAKLREIV